MSELPATIPSTMTGVRCHGPGDYRLETLPTPVPGEGELLVRVLQTGICAGDAKCFHGAPRFWANGLIGSYCRPPVVPGHEFVGEVVLLGAGAEKFAVGDRVVAEPIIPCEECRFCRSGDYHMCVPHTLFGFRQDGAMAEYMVFPRRARVYRVPDEVPTSHAVFTEPLSCALHAVNRGGIQQGDVVVVAGCGALGCGMVAGAKKFHPKCIIALDVFDWKLDAAKDCGADVTLNARDPDIITKVRELSNGDGCDVYLHASGHPTGVVQGLEMLRIKGTFVEYSVFADKVTCDWTTISDSKELTIKGGHLSPYTFPLALDLLASKVLPMEKIITHRLPLATFQDGINYVSKAAECCKVVLKVAEDKTEGSPAAAIP